MKMRKLFILTALCLALSHPGIAEEITVKDERYSSFLAQHFPQRPLDFLMVADHAENLGLAPMIEDKNPDLLNTPFGERIASDTPGMGVHLADLVYAATLNQPTRPRLLTINK